MQAVVERAQLTAMLTRWPMAKVTASAKPPPTVFRTTARNTLASSMRALTVAVIASANSCLTTVPESAGNSSAWG